MSAWCLHLLAGNHLPIWSTIWLITPFSPAPLAFYETVSRRPIIVWFLNRAMRPVFGLRLLLKIRRVLVSSITKGQRIQLLEQKKRKVTPLIKCCDSYKISTLYIVVLSRLMSHFNWLLIVSGWHHYLVGSTTAAVLIAQQYSATQSWIWEARLDHKSKPSVGLGGHLKAWRTVVLSTLINSDFQYGIFWAEF